MVEFVQFGEYMRSLMSLLLEDATFEMVILCNENQQLFCCSVCIATFTKACCSFITRESATVLINIVFCWCACIDNFKTITNSCNAVTLMSCWYNRATRFF